MIIRLTKQSVRGEIYQHAPRNKLVGQSTWSILHQPYIMQKPVVSTVQTADLNTIIKIVVLTQVAQWQLAYNPLTSTSNLINSVKAVNLVITCDIWASIDTLSVNKAKYFCQTVFSISDFLPAKVSVICINFIASWSETIKRIISLSSLIWFLVNIKLVKSIVPIWHNQFEQMLLYDTIQQNSFNSIIIIVIQIIE